MKTIKTFEINEIPNPHFISVRALHASEQAQFEHLILEPGQEQKKHIAYTNVYLYVLEGEGVLEAGDEIIQLAADMLVEMPPETPHRLVNHTAGRLRLLNVKAPRATKGTHVVVDSGQ
ncbi:MAG: cupin domain-containing protein [Anaerolineales bacterium]|jgi:mannose-6-phosphate isomerase-like protein (cupin superfamily)|nr:cupin domain-containing protein [Anaerolineales bacterium]